MHDLKNFLKGLVLGISNIIPGVSAGTLAVVMGIYDKLLQAIAFIFKDFKKNFRFLFFIGLGIGCGILFFSYILEKLIGKYPWQVNYLFMGLIAGSFGMLFKTAKSYNPKKSHFIYFFITFSILVIMKFMTNESIVKIIVDVNFKNIMILFFSGFIASCALILPGISGAFILMLLGIYNSIISAVSNFNVLILFPFGLGVLAGLLLMSKFIQFLLEKYKSQSYMAILGFTVGSIISIFPGFEFSFLGLTCLIIFLIGYIISFYIFRFNSK